MKTTLKSLRVEANHALKVLDMSPTDAAEKLQGLAQKVLQSADDIETAFENLEDDLKQSQQDVEDARGEAEDAKMDRREFEDMYDEIMGSGNVLNEDPKFGGNTKSITRHLRTDNLYEEAKTEILNRISANYTLEELQRLEAFIKSKKPRYNEFVS